MQSRRHFLRTCGLASGAAALAGGTKLAEAATGLPEANVGRPILGERYAGFVILPQGAPEPFDVVMPERMPPIFCQAGEGGPEPTGVTTSVSSAYELKAMMGVPTFSPFGLGSELYPIGGNLMQYTDGDVFAGVLTFESRDAQTGEVQPNVRLQMQRYFPRPLPLWESTPAAPGEPFTEYKKVGFLPAPGLVEQSGLGYIFHWIQGDVYYRLFVENQGTFGEARRIAGALNEVHSLSQQPVNH